MAGKGFDYYRNSYTHEQLWEMLVTQGDSWSVQQAGSVWSTAKGGLESAREQLNTSMLATVDYWQGPASEEFQRRMRLVYEYSENSEEEMRKASEITIPDISQALADAQGKAQEQDLNPASELEYEDWLEDVKNVKPEDPDFLEKQEQYRSEYETYKADRHEAIALIVADLGDKYSSYKKDFEPPAPPPSDMPGTGTYQPPTSGVFGNNGLNPANSVTTPGAIGTGPGGAGNENGLVGSDPYDLDPVDGWAPGSYGDIDTDISGGLAAGTGGSPLGGGGFGPSGGAPSSVGGAGFTGGAGAGLFGPARGGGGAGNAPGRGVNPTNSPGRSGAAKPGGTSSGRGGMGGNNTGGRGGMNRSGVGPRGGTRSGYADDDDDEEYTRETWLREDDVNWSRNNVPDEELDD